MRRLAAAVALGAAWAPAQIAATSPELSRALQAFVDSKEARAVAVLVGRGGTVLHESYHGLREDGKPVGADTRFCIGSCSKSLVSALALLLVADGKLDLDKPASTWLPELASVKLGDGTPARSPTVRELLQHTAGIYSQRDPMTAARKRWIRDFSLTLDRSVAGILAEPLATAPGERFAYSGAGYCVAGRVLEVAGGSDLETLARKLLFTPLAMSRTTWFPAAGDADIANADGPRLAELAPHRLGKKLALPLVGGSVYSTARDCARFLRAITESGHALLPVALRRELTAKTTGRDYGLGWRVRKRDGAVVGLSHNGALYGYRARFDVDVVTGRYFVVLVTLGRAGNRQTPRRIFATVAEHAGGQRAREQELDARIERLARAPVDSKVAVGVIVGVLHDGETTFRGFGRTERGGGRVPGPDTVWEIGSITKVFTGILLAHAVESGLVALDDPVAKYLPEGTEVPEYEGKPIRLVDLTTHGSGLPRMPVNFRPKDPRNPFADYGVAQLYEGLRDTRLRHAPGTTYAYSNLGVGLLGHVLSRVFDRGYDVLVREVITGPLGMTDTAVHPTKSMRERLAKPYGVHWVERWSWDFDCLAGCGALRSTARDLLKFARANLAPPDTKLGRALRAAQVVHSPKWKGPQVALGWHLVGHNLFHNGGTGGYASFLMIDRKRKTAVVVIANTVSRRIDAVGRSLMSFLADRDQSGK